MKKIIAFYLPQFHEIPENNKWWGKGFTEWDNVRKAESLFEGHVQPKIPLNNNYYDLTNIDVIRWQAQIAKENNIYGFCFYHYWFDNRPLLEKPLFLFLNDHSIELPFCFCWANESWTNGWAKADASVIMEQKYGEKSEWKKHFDFILPFLKDKRYICEDGKPIFVIYRPYLFSRMIDMMDYWNQLAIESGFSGIKYISQRFEEPSNYKELYDYFDYHIEYQPKADWLNSEKKYNFVKKIQRNFHNFILDLFNIDFSLKSSFVGPVKITYDDMWKAILNHNPTDDKTIAGGFVNWDNTPRHKRRGVVFTGSSPDKFYKYLLSQLAHIDRNYKNDYLFMFAWNEWGEGGYLEPDKENGYNYLFAIKKATEEYENRKNSEFN